MSAAPLPPLLLRPGWYWWDFDTASEGPAFAAFGAANRDSFRVRTLWTSQPREVVLFEVLKPLNWTLGGKPTRAPKASKTTIGDMAQTPTPSPGFVQAVEDISGQSYAAVKAAAASIGTVGTVLLWGGAGILLWNLMNATAPEPKRRVD